MRATSDRRLAIRDFISAKRHTSVSELMQEFDISKRTVLRDLDAITDTTSFYTTTGANGGIHACEGWNSSNHYLSSAQVDFLKKIQEKLQNESDIKMMESILEAFAMPTMS